MRDQFSKSINLYYCRVYFLTIGRNKESPIINENKIQAYSKQHSKNIHIKQPTNKCFISSFSYAWGKNSSL